MILIGFAAIQSWVHRHTLNADGISYIEIAELYARAQWTDALNAYWSPLYSWVLTPIPSIGLPPRWEFPAIHAINFGIFIVSLLAFEQFFKAVVATRGTNADDVSSWVWLFGYAVFGWSALELVGSALVTPDLLALALMLSAGACILRIEQGGADRREFVRLGVLLGLAYLAKSFFLSISVAALIILFVRHAHRRSVLFSAMTFVAVAAPFITAISWKQGHFTAGEAGRLNLVWEVGRLEPAYRHWQGRGDRFGTPHHPTRLLSTSPALFEFADPIPGSYPIWFDPSYWYSGARVSVSPKLVIRRALESTSGYAVKFGALMLSVVVLAFSSDLRRPGSSIRPHVTLLAISGVGLLLYALVLVCDRYIAPFVVLSAVSVGAGAMVADTRKVRVHRACVVALITIWVLGATPRMAYSVYSVRQDVAGGQLSAIQPYRQAAEFQRLGLKSGDNIALIGDGFSAFWPHLARVRIVAEVPTWETAAFWSNGLARERIMKELRRLDVRAIVTQESPHPNEAPSWVPVDRGRWHVLFLRSTD